MRKILFLTLVFHLSLSAWDIATVERVVDGDTIIIKTADNKTYSSRLIGFDTVESMYNRKLLTQSKRCEIKPSEMIKIGLKAKKYTSKRLKKGSKIHYLDFGVDYFSRKLIWIDGFNYRIVREGFAKVYKRADLPRDIKKSLQQAQKIARSRKLGIWSLLSTDKRCY